MSIATVVTRGYGSFGSIAVVPTRGYGAYADTVQPRGGGGGPRRKRKKTEIIRFSDFEARADYERRLRDAVVKSGIILTPPAAIIERQESLERVARVDAETVGALRAADTEIKVSAELRARLQAMRNDEAEMLLILLALA